SSNGAEYVSPGCNPGYGMRYLQALKGRDILLRPFRVQFGNRFFLISFACDFAKGNKNDMAKILLVEDNEMNRDMLSRRLVRKDYEVVIAVDGAEGVSKAQTENPDLILMDISLPVIDGREATRRLKAAPETRAIPIIALTAHAMAGDR